MSAESEFELASGLPPAHAQFYSSIPVDGMRLFSSKAYLMPPQGRYTSNISRGRTKSVPGYRTGVLADALAVHCHLPLGNVGIRPTRRFRRCLGLHCQLLLRSVRIAGRVRKGREYGLAIHLLCPVGLQAAVLRPDLISNFSEAR